MNRVTGEEDAVLSLVIKLNILSDDIWVGPWWGKRVNYADLGEKNSKQREQPVQKVEEKCDKMFKEEEVGWCG